jgi:hypothetical protein
MALKAKGEDLDECSLDVVADVINRIVEEPGQHDVSHESEQPKDKGGRRLNDQDVVVQGHPRFFWYHCEVDCSRAYHRQAVQKTLRPLALDPEK